MVAGAKHRLEAAQLGGTVGTTDGAVFCILKLSDSQKIRLSVDSKTRELTFESCCMVWGDDSVSKLLARQA